MSGGLIYLCPMPDPPLVDPDPDCPNASEHTPCPSGYTQWFDWAGRMYRTHVQVKCRGCGLYSIWRQYRTLPSAALRGDQP